MLSLTYDEWIKLCPSKDMSCYHYVVKISENIWNILFKNEAYP